MKQDKKDIQNFRENFRKYSRRQNLQEKFSQKRKQNQHQTQMINEQMFHKIMNIFQQQGANYYQLFQQHKESLKYFSCFEKYCYRLLNLSSVIYENFLMKPSDQCALQILKNICYYQQIQIPQTQQFAEALMRLFLQKYFQVGELLFYLTKNSKYGLLCARLVDLKIIPLISQALNNSQIKYSQYNQKYDVFTQTNEKQSLNYLIFQLLSIISSLFTIQPLLNLGELQQIANILNFNHEKNLDEYYTFFIGDILNKVAKQFQPCREVAQLLNNKFQRALNVIYQEDDMLPVCVNIIEYFWKSEILLSTNIILLVLHGLNTNFTNNKIKILKLLLKLVLNQKDQMEIQANKIADFSKIPSFLQFNSMFQTKKNKKVSHIDKQNQKRVCQSLIEEKYLRQLIRMARISQDVILKQLTLKIILNLLQQLLTRQILQSQPKQVLQRIYTQEQFLILLQESMMNGNFYQQTEPALNIINSISSYLKEQEFQQELMSFRRLLQQHGFIKIIQGLMNSQNSKAIIFESESILELLYH